MAGGVLFLLRSYPGFRRPKISQKMEFEKNHLQNSYKLIMFSLAVQLISGPLICKQKTCFWCTFFVRARLVPRTGAGRSHQNGAAGPILRFEGVYPANAQFGAAASPDSARLIISLLIVSLSIRSISGGPFGKDVRVEENGESFFLPAGAPASHTF